MFEYDNVANGANLIGYLEIMLHGIMSVAIVVGVYYWKKREEKRGTRYKLADMLSIEVSDIGKMVRSDRLRRPDQAFRNMIPRKIYDGLVFSGNIADFDKEIQIKLYYFYNYVEKKSMGDIQTNVTNLTRMIEGFRDRNGRRHGRAA